MSATTIWARVRWIWVRAGAIALVVFPVWMLIAFRATSHARTALSSDPRVSVARGSHHWTFEPRVQLGDWPATITREEQQRQTLEAVLAVLRAETAE